MNTKRITNKREYLLKLMSICLVFAVLFTANSSLFSGKTYAKHKGPKSTDKLIAMTFDDGPSLYTSNLIDSLNERGVKATFFIVGQNAKYYPDVVKKAADSGHQIGNHSYDHALLTELSYEDVKDEIDSTNKLLKKADGKKKHYVRPPYGEYNDNVSSAAGAPLIYWSVDTEDWKSLDASAVYNSIMNDSYDGAMVLCHDLYDTTIDGALMAIDELLSEGYKFVTVEELFKLRGIKMENGVMYYHARPGEGTVKEAEPTPTLEPTPEPVEYTKKLCVNSTKLYKDKKLTKVGGYITAGTEIEVAKGKGSVKQIKTLWGKEGYISSSALKEADNSIYDNTGNSFTRIIKKSSLLYSDEKLLSPVGIANSKESVSVINMGDVSSYVSFSDGREGYVANSNLQNYFSIPLKSVILDVPEEGELLVDTNLRSSPDKNSSILGVISKGAYLEITGSDGMWLKINFGDVEGYIRDFTVSRSDSDSFTEAHISKNTKLRSESSSSGALLSSLKSGSLVYIINQTEDYYLVLTSNGCAGYVEVTAVETNDN